MAESTASQSGIVDVNRAFYKDKLAIGILKQHLQTYFALFTEKSQLLQGIVSEILSEPQKTII